ncbi:YoaK family protein [Streptomyces sp. NPDC006333]|uniref:YoaK family protein n=1 Tax=Streptomyces sp. NPDC006333 TaxID=3156753 RepID=UPI0033BE6E13
MAAPLAVMALRPSAPGEQGWPGHARAAQFLLTLASGAVNAVSFLALGGVFTSVMTANSALLGLALGNGHLSLANLAALAIAAYLVGAAAGSWITAATGRVPLTGVTGALLAESLLLWAVFASWLFLDGAPGTTARGVLLAVGAVSMGCQSGSVRVVAGSSVTTAYITGALTGLVAQATVERKLQRHNALVILLLPVGAAVGGAAVRWAPLLAPAVPAVLVTAALLATVVRRRSAPDDGPLPDA